LQQKKGRRRQQNVVVVACFIALQTNKKKKATATTPLPSSHSYDILGARMLWKPKEARILKNFIDQPM